MDNTPYIFLVSAPSEAEFLGYSGEHTCILYAAAVLWDAIKRRAVLFHDHQPLTEDHVRLFAWRALSTAVWDELTRELHAARPRLVCVSYTTATSDVALRIAALVHQESPHTAVIFGGPHEDGTWPGAMLPSGAERSADVDVSVSEEGEYPLAFLTEVAMGLIRFDRELFGLALRTRADKIKALPGNGAVTIRAGDQMPMKIMRHNQLPLNLPRIPRDLQARDRPHLARGFNVFGIVENSTKTAQIMTARGCGWRCSFCAEWRAAYVRTVEDVIAEIEEARALGYGAIFFEDSTFLQGYGHGLPVGSAASPSRKDARHIFIDRLLAYLENAGMEWGCQTRVDTIEPEIVRRMRIAGCTYIYFGAESASDVQLNDMEKQQSKEEIAKAFQHVREVGIRIGLSTLFGAPSREDAFFTRESDSTVNETIAFFAREVQKGGIVTVSRNITAYYPGSMTGIAELRANGPDLWVCLPCRDQFGIPFPWNRFEDGAGTHATNVNSELASMIVQRGDRLLGPWSIKFYIHPSPDHRSPVQHDFVHYSSAVPWNAADGVGGDPADTGDESEGPVIAPNFAESLRVELKKSLDDWTLVHDVPTVLGIGMHILEAFRQIAYINRPTASSLREHRFSPLRHEWRGIWNSMSSDIVLDALDKCELGHAAAVVVPAILPETGHRLDLAAIAGLLAEQDFAGRLIVDVSDAAHFQSFKQVTDQLESYAGRISFVFDPARIFSGSHPCQTVRWSDRHHGNVAAGALLSVINGELQSSSEADLPPMKRLDGALWADAWRRRMAQQSRRLLDALTREPAKTGAPRGANEASNFVPPNRLSSARTEDAPHILTLSFQDVDHLALVERLWRDHSILATYLGSLQAIRFQLTAASHATRFDDVASAIHSLLPGCGQVNPPAHLG